MLGKFDKSHPFAAKIKARYPLTKNGSTKETYHLVLDIEGSGLTFKVGDSLGILPQNDPLLVQRLIKAMEAEGDEMIQETRSGLLFSVRDFLTHRANIARLTSSFMSDIPLEDRSLLKEYLLQNEPLDFFNKYGRRASLQDLCNRFSPLLPRFYSIASSQEALPTEAHLTVALSTHMHRAEKRYGVASYFLSHLAEEQHTPIPLYVQSSRDFTLPNDHKTPLIMIGPGTGVAPFRAFMQERLHKNAPGKNWLFFGERNRHTDFFYEEFWHHLSSQNLLRLDLAFSRDSEAKTYVQHRMLEQSRDLWSWLQEGAILYVCGDADPMAKDVEATLLRIFKEQGGLSDDNAKAYLKSLRTSKRYLTDVY